MTRARYGSRTGRVVSNEKVCSGPSHDVPTSLTLDHFPTRHAASGNIVPKSYCRDCLREIQRIDREKKWFAKPRTEPKPNPLKGVRKTLPEDQRGTKTCSECGKTKPVSEFNYTVRAKGKLQPKCRECQSIETKANYVPHPRQAKPKPLREPKVDTEKVCRGTLHRDGVRLPVESFNWHNQTKGRRQSYCRDCQVFENAKRSKGQAA